MQTAMTIYRGYDIAQEPNGQYVWTDEAGRVHTQGGYDTEEQAMDAIDAHRRAKAAS